MGTKSRLVNIMSHFGYTFVSFDPVQQNFKFVRNLLEKGMIFVYIKYSFLKMLKPKFVDYNFYTSDFRYENLLYLDNVAISDRLKIKETLERW